MKIVFLIRHPLYLRNYESVLRALAARGDRIHMVFTPLEKQVDTTLLDSLTADHPEITSGAIAPRKGWWWPASDALRMIRDYLRYLEPEYATAQSLVARGARRLPPLFRMVFERLPVFRKTPFRRAIDGLCRLLDRAIPADPGCLALLKREAPDLVMVTPMVDFTYSQTDYVKAAKALGIPTVLAVASWDNLTNKGLVQVAPDRVLVWNDIQRDEAVRMHRLPADSLRLTGAQIFDHWFDMRPSIDRAGFCARVDAAFDPDKPILLYLCSSTFICPDEVSFVKEWLGHVRASADANVREANVIIRPHPAHTRQWQTVDLAAEFGRVAVWPRAGGVPVDDTRKRDYFDSLHHGDAVIGINTSGFLEAGIVGRRTLTLQTGHFGATQEGTLHYHYLTDGGLLTVATSFAQHLDQLSETLEDAARTAGTVREFIRRFLRPQGLETPSTPIFVQALEEAAALRLSPETPPAWAPVVRGLAKPVMALPRRYILERTSAGMWRGIERTSKSKFMPPAGQSTEHSAMKTKGFTKLTRDALERIALSDKPVIIGPWMSEVGFELLYWIPLLRWARHTYGLDTDRLIVVSRGGVAHWYGDLAHRYVDLFDLYTPEAYVALNEARQDGVLQKHKSISPVEQEVLDKVKAKLGITEEVEVLHPSLMYSGVYRYHWSQRSSMDHLWSHARFEPLAAPEPGELEAKLPADYYAVRFYSRESFTDSDGNRSFVRGMLERMLRKADVVLLDSPFQVDDHANVEWMKAAESGEGHAHRLIRASEWMVPSNNLEVQTRIIARSRGFVGTYGGLSYLAPLLGRPSIAFHETTGDLKDAHVNTAINVFNGMNLSFVLLTPREAEMLGDFL